VDLRAVACRGGDDMSDGRGRNPGDCGCVVQPMTTPTGVAFEIDYQYGQTKRRPLREQFSQEAEGRSILRCKRCGRANYDPFGDVGECSFCGEDPRTPTPALVVSAPLSWTRGEEHPEEQRLKKLRVRLRKGIDEERLPEGPVRDAAHLEIVLRRRSFSTEIRYELLPVLSKNAWERYGCLSFTKKCLVLLEAQLLEMFEPVDFMGWWREGEPVSQRRLRVTTSTIEEKLQKLTKELLVERARQREVCRPSSDDVPLLEGTEVVARPKKMVAELNVGPIRRVDIGLSPFREFVDNVLGKAEDKEGDRRRDMTAKILENAAKEVSDTYLLSLPQRGVDFGRHLSNLARTIGEAGRAWFEFVDRNALVKFKMPGVSEVYYGSIKVK
jgi:hypothetical protein